MQAKRINGYSDYEEGKICYYKNDGKWYLINPDVGLGSLEEHEVIEHEDGTITVRPSILITMYNKGEKVEVHGYLELGKWRDV